MKGQITFTRKDIYLFMVYGIAEHPMTFAADKEINSKKDVIKVAKLYFSRWRIEEYFRYKKQIFQFKNFRVRKRTANPVKVKVHFCYYRLSKGISCILSYAKEGV